MAGVCVLLKKEAYIMETKRRIEGVTGNKSRKWKWKEVKKVKVKKEDRKDNFWNQSIKNAQRIIRLLKIIGDTSIEKLTLIKN